MAHIVEFDPGDILVIGGQVGFDPDIEGALLEKLKGLLSASMILVLEGPVDLGVVRKRLAEGSDSAVAGG